MRFLLFSIIFFLLSNFSYSKPVSIQKVYSVGINFYSTQHYRMYGTFPSQEITEITTGVIDGKIAYYVCNFDARGFVILSTDDIEFPVIGYSFDSRFETENMPEALQVWLRNICSGIPASENNNTSGLYTDLWDELSQSDYRVNYSTKSTQVMPELLTLRWNQDSPYNLYCPSHLYGPGGHCYAGCVATAMAQIMKYWNYPEFGRDSILYTGNNLLNFQQTRYRWESMPNTININSPDSCKNAIAELMFHCGVTVNMYYGPDGSAAYTESVPYALEHYFGYHLSAGYAKRKNYSDRDWDILIRDNLDNRRPVLYSGSGTGGHAFVCDGYQDTCFYHINWGWSGSFNGYYYNNDLTPGSNDFTQQQGAVIDIMPYFHEYCREGRILSDLYRSFDDGSGYSYYWNNTKCDWLISPEGASKIVLTFLSFSTESDSDILTIYDGGDTTYPVLGRFSGSIMPGQIESSSGELYLVFETNGSNQAPGWEIFYEADNSGISTININRSSQIFPNPASGLVYLNISNSLVKINTVEIYNIAGKIVRSCNTVLNKDMLYEIDISGIAPGFYFLKTGNSMAGYTHRLVIGE